MANPILLQMKMARVIEEVSKKKEINNDAALDMFYHSKTYDEIKSKVADIHCRSDGYLAENIINESKIAHGA